MQFTLLAAIAASAGFVAAQTPNGCDAQSILDACLALEQGKASSCGPQDYICLCNNYININQCYNNCPGDLGRSSVQNQQIVYCNAAGPQSAASIAAASTMPSAMQTTAPTTTAGAAESATSAAGAAASSATTGAGAVVMAPATSVLALLLGVAGLL